MKHVEVVKLLGSHISEDGNIVTDLQHHMKERYLVVSKFYNLIRSNRVAPSKATLKVLEACVTSSLLHNCETFADIIPDNLEKLYHELIKVCLNVRWNTPNHLALIESGMLNLQAIIQSRQYKFYSKFIKNIEPGSPRACVFFALRGQNVKYFQYYSNLVNEFESVKALKLHQVRLVKEKI